MKYNWQQSDWPNFQFETNAIEEMLLKYLHNAGKLEGALRSLNESDREETITELLIAEAIKTSEIEGEFMSRADVASSIRRNLGLHHQKAVSDQRARGIADVMVSARKSYNDPLTETILVNWHSALLSHENQLAVGKWRSHEEPMQIVSGALGFERVHFEAPPSSRIEEEMTRFIQWFNDTAPKQPKAIVHAPIRAAIAHLYFESIHPFEDGNGRIGRAIAEKALAQTTGYPGLTSLSITIEQNKKEYYVQLEKAQRSNKITPWISYFVKTIVEGQGFAKETIDFTLLKSRYFDQYSHQLNPTQLKVLKRMSSQGPAGFEGGMTAGKYSRLARVSKATATRHLTELLKLDALNIQGQGRSTRYHINFVKPQ
jgi:Fic family protein